MDHFLAVEKLHPVRLDGLEVGAARHDRNFVAGCGKPRREVPAHRPRAEDTDSHRRILASLELGPMQGKILIAGAGLGGLAAAACLMKRGFDVRVFEQAPKLGEVGAGIQQSANAVKVLYHLGLRSELDRVGVKPQDYEFRRFDSAELLHKIAFAGAHQEKHGTPYYHLHRADFHQMLVDKVRAMDPSCITLNAKVAGFTEGAGGVKARLADGAEVSG